jgi:hypothetical protein
VSAVDLVEAAGLGVLLAFVVICVLLWLLSSLGLLDHDGWVPRERRLHPRDRRMPRDFTDADVARVREQQRRTEMWLDAHEPRRPALATYRSVSIQELVALINHVPGWLAAGTLPPSHLPVSPDPRRKES